MRTTWMVPLALPLFIFGCAHKQETKSQAAVSPPVAAPVAQQTAPAAPSSSCNRDLDCNDAQLCIRGQCVDISDGLAECSQIRVHFPFNSSEIDESDKPGLDRAARCLKADHALHVTVAGNADERGTEEYNMALGDKRANTVSQYFKSLGASEAQLKTVSYGKENPLCSEHDEACWARNRRADLAVAQIGQHKRKHH